MNAHDFVEEHRREFLDQLLELLRIPSVSTKEEHREDVARAAQWVADHLREIGLENVRLFEKPGAHPIVYGEWLKAGDDKPTVLIYGHYDVQPPDPLDEWETPPFEPDVRDDKIFARGASDDKGQMFANIKAVQAMLESEGGPPANIKMILEGEEETSSEYIEEFVSDEKNHPLLAADAILVSDGSIPATDKPALCYGLRGIVYMELEVFGPEHDLHSGGYGGIVHNPAQALCEIIAALHDDKGRVTVPGFYDKVRPITDREREILAESGLDEDEWRRRTGAPQPWGEEGYSLIERVTARPTLEVNGLVSGFIEEGAKTVLPAKALAKISCRLVPDQDPHEIAELVERYVNELTPPTVRTQMRVLHYGYPAIVDLESQAAKAAAKAYELGFGKPPIFIREGGSIPIVATFQRELKAPVLLMGYGLPDDRLHAPNEKFDIENFYKGIHTTIYFFETFAG